MLFVALHITLFSLKTQRCLQAFIITVLMVKTARAGLNFDQWKDKMPFMLFSTTGMFSELFSLALQILVSSKPASSMKLPLIPLAGPL